MWGCSEGWYWWFVFLLWTESWETGTNSISSLESWRRSPWSLHPPPLPNIGFNLLIAADFFGATGPSDFRVSSHQGVMKVSQKNKACFSPHVLWPHLWGTFLTCRHEKIRNLGRIQQFYEFNNTYKNLQKHEGGGEMQRERIVFHFCFPALRWEEVWGEKKSANYCLSYFIQNQNQLYWESMCTHTRKLIQFFFIALNVHTER